MQAGHSRDIDVEMKEVTSKPKFDFGSDFSEIINTSAFVDKTMLIKAILVDESTLAISAPRRFGKSTNMNMVKRFLEIEVDERGNRLNLEETSNYKLFKDNEEKLEICKDIAFFNEHFGKYPVMCIDFMLLNTLFCYDSMLGDLKNILLNLYTEHKYLLYVNNLWGDDLYIEDFKNYLINRRNLSLTERQIKHGFSFLAKVLHKYFNRQVFVMIDEYDSPVSALIMNDIDDSDNEDILKFVRETISTLVEGNPHVSRVFLTGCSRMFGSLLCPDGDNIAHYSFLQNSNFIPFYGFTDNEIKQLLTTFNIPNKLEEVENWYGGYKQLHNDDLRIYSTWSIINYLKNNSLKNYWAEGGTVTNLRRLLGLTGFESSFHSFLNGEPIKIESIEKVSLNQILRLKDLINILPHVSVTRKDVNLFLQLLCDGGGYFNVVEREENYLTLEIPNEEIKSELAEMMYLMLFHKQKAPEERKYNFTSEYTKNFLTKMNSLYQGEKSTFKQFKLCLKELFSEIDRRHYTGRENNPFKPVPSTYYM